MKVSLDLLGGKELAAAIAGLPLRLSRKAKRDALFVVAEPMRSRMADFAPRGEAPHMADNIVVSGGRGGIDEFFDEKATTVAIGPAKGFQHGILQEFGTEHHGPQAFARPAFDQEAPKVIRELAPVLWQVLKRHGLMPGGGL